MGKLRRKGKNQSSTTPYSLSSRQKQTSTSSVICSHDGSEVAPLPTEIMDCSSVLSLTTTTTSCSEKGDVGRKQSQRRKKEKRGLKKEIWKNKIELINKTEVEKKAEEERRKTVIVGDMQPLVNSLPTLSAKQVGESEAPSKQKRKTISVLSEIEKYRAVLRHPEFQKNPLATISEHVQNAVASGVL